MKNNETFMLTFRIKMAITFDTKPLLEGQEKVMA